MVHNYLVAESYLFFFEHYHNYPTCLGHLQVKLTGRKQFGEFPILTASLKKSFKKPVSRQGRDRSTLLKNFTFACFQ